MTAPGGSVGGIGRARWLTTPQLDRLAAEGVHFRNAMVTTALCSPSRASIFTGLYAHQRRMVDNTHAIDPSLVFFPEYLQRAGYETAFVVKWHMGLEGRKGDKPFMLFLSHRAVQSDFIPAARHKGRYANAPFTYLATMTPPVDPGTRPMRVQNPRNSCHVIDFKYNSKISIAEYYRRYAETLLAVDESAGRVMGRLGTRGVLHSSLILYMGDNGFAIGEHSLTDKRTAYEESIRIPMLAR